MKTNVIKPPSAYYHNSRAFKIFIGGSIEMGTAEDWQKRLISELTEANENDGQYSRNVDILSPRRDDWDSSLPQDPTRGTQFYDQVMWERGAQQCANLKVYYFAKDTVSPITLLELGEFGTQRDTIVYVDPDYKRFGNVVIMCKESGIPYHVDYDLWLHAVVLAMRVR